MTTIAEFLEARWTETEAVARDAVDATPGTIGRAADQWTYQHEGFAGEDYWTISTESAEIVTGGYEGGGAVAEEHAVHIALHDPERELKVIEANRAILAIHAVQGSLVSDYSDCVACMDVDAYDSYPCRTVRLMAQPFNQHPDYQGEWAP